MVQRANDRGPRRLKSLKFGTMGRPLSREKIWGLAESRVPKSGFAVSHVAFARKRIAITREDRQEYPSIFTIWMFCFASFPINLS